MPGERGTTNTYWWVNDELVVRDPPAPNTLQGEAQAEMENREAELTQFIQTYLVRADHNWNLLGNEPENIFIDWDGTIRPWQRRAVYEQLLNPFEPNQSQQIHSVTPEEGPMENTFTIQPRTNERASAIRDRIQAVHHLDEEIPQRLKWLTESEETFKRNQQAVETTTEILERLGDDPLFIRFLQDTSNHSPESLLQYQKDVVQDAELNNERNRQRLERAKSNRLEQLGDAKSIAHLAQELARANLTPSTGAVVNLPELSVFANQHPNIFYFNSRIVDNRLKLNMGVCNLAMDCSGGEAFYDQPIPLAPAIFCLTIDPEGYVHYDLGECHRYNGFSHSFHPHWLSDSPCLGTFGSPFIDAIKAGNIDVAITILLAFLSQYNAADDAGAYAYRWLEQPNEAANINLQRMQSNIDNPLVVFKHDLFNQANTNWNEWLASRPQQTHNSDDDHDYYCHATGRGLNEDDAYLGADDHWYCESAFDQRFTYCERCGAVEWREEMTYIDNEGLDVCQNCYINCYAQCSDCEEHFLETQLTNHVCGECLEIREEAEAQDDDHD